VDIRLVGVAFLPPVPPDPTARFSLATSEIHQAKITRRDLLRRRSPFLRLGEPLVVTTPAPVVLDGPSVRNTRARVVQRHERSVLRRPTVVGAAVVVVVVFTGPRVKLVRRRSLEQRRTLVVLRDPSVVTPPPNVMGGIAVQLVQRPRPRVRSRLSPPVVVGP